MNIQENEKENRKCKPFGAILLSSGSIFGELLK